MGGNGNGKLTKPENGLYAVQVVASDIKLLLSIA
jgi:hypothetical protein